RDLATDHTVLLSAERDPGTGAMTEDPVEGGAVDSIFGAGASLSADGSTVAWYGAHLPAQVPMLGDERNAIETGSANPVKYSEPLWRRVPSAADAAPPTRRIVGGGDPLAVGCPAIGTLGNPACDGPFPQLLANGLVCGENIPGWLDTPGFVQVEG